MRFFSCRKNMGETPGLTEAREAFEKVESDSSRVEELRLGHEVRIRRNDFGPKFAAALHLRRTRKW